MERKLLPHVRSVDSFLLSSNLQSKRTQGSDDPLSWIERVLVNRFAEFYYHQRAFSEALRATRRATDLELLLSEKHWLKTIPSLKWHLLIARILTDFGELTEAGEVFANLLSACKDILPFDDPFTMKVAREATALWNHRPCDEAFRQIIAASGGVKIAVWLSETICNNETTENVSSSTRRMGRL